MQPELIGNVQEMTAVSTEDVGAAEWTESLMVGQDVELPAGMR
jgi:hypothetical protein